MTRAPGTREIQFGTLARAAEGLTQWRPLLMGFLTLLTTGVVMVLASLAMSVSVVLGLLVMLTSIVVALAGSSAVGIMLMDKAKNEPIRSFASAASAGLMCLPKFLLFGLILWLTVIAYLIVAAVVYFICKIPVIGAILAFVAHPVLVLVAAAFLVIMIWVVGPLMAPALWSGLSVKAALANVLSIARKRLVEVVLMEVVLYVILGLICVMLFAGLMPATITLTGMAMSITGGANAMLSAAMGGYGGYGGMSTLSNMMSSGSSMGLLGGLGVMYCMVSALLAQVMIMGLNLIYLQARESVDPSEAEGALDGLIGDVRKKAEEAKERTMAAAERAKQAAAQKMQERAEAKAEIAQQRAEAEREATQRAEHEAAQAQAAQEQAAAQTALHCSNCQANVGKDDVFCDECGHKLK